MHHNIRLKGNAVAITVVHRVAAIPHHLMMMAVKAEIIKPSS
jgi:hypothetical protein